MTGQRKGYASLNGFVTEISDATGKVIDCEVLNKKCAQAYDEFNASHDSECSINYKCSAASMKPKGVVACFERSFDM